MDHEIKTAETNSVPAPKAERKMKAKFDAVILKHIDDNDYSQKDITPQIPGDLVKSEENLNRYEYKGLVMAVGNEVKSNVKVGEIVHHSKHAGTVFTFDGENYLSLEDYLICAIE